jgi:hypothetical protein
VLGIVALVGLGADAVEYYTRDHYPGTYYPWVLMGPFGLGLLTLMWITVTEITPAESSDTVSDSAHRN